MSTTTTTLLRQLAEFQRSLTSAGVEPRQLLSEACSGALRLSGAEGAVLEIEEKDTVVVVSACGSAATSIGYSSPLSRTLLGVPLPLSTTFSAGDVQQDSNRDHRRLEGVRAVLAVPLRHGRSRGVLSVVSSRANGFDDDARAALELLVATVDAELGRMMSDDLHEAAIAERTVHLLAAVEREHQLVRLMQEIAVAANEAKTLEQAVRTCFERICRYTGWPVGHLFLVGEDSSDKLVSTPIWHIENPTRFNAIKRMTDGIDWRRGVGLPGRVLESKKPQWTADVRKELSFVRSNIAASHGVKSSFAIPLMSGTEVAGVLEFFCQDHVDPDERLLEVAANVGTQLGRVIERKRSQLALAASEKRYRLLFERNLAGVFRTRMDGVVTDCNDAFAHVFGVAEKKESIGSSLLERFSSASARDEYVASLQNETFLTNFEAEMEKIDRSKIWVLMNVAVTGEGDDRSVEGTLLDITERKEMEEKVAYQAHHDPLTALSNRAFFITQLDRALSVARRSGQTVGLLYLDLDGFKPINDELGHAAGDAILQETGVRLNQCVRGSDVVGRMGGDEFTVLLSSLSKPEDAETVAKKVVAAIERPFVYQGQELRVTASMGISIHPANGSDADTLIAAADEAMYRVKRRGRCGFEYFSAPAAVQAES